MSGPVVVTWRAGEIGRALQARAGACHYPMPKKKPYKVIEGLTRSGLHLINIALAVCRGGVSRLEGDRVHRGGQPGGLGRGPGKRAVTNQRGSSSEEAWTGLGTA